MSNLGMYQVMTKTAKMMGGPGYLILAVGGVGYCVFRIIEAGGRGAVKVIKRHRNSKDNETGRKYTIIESYRDEHGLKLRKGDRVRVIETDGDCYLIEKLGDNNNPYFISGEKLKTIVSQRGKTIV